jgi:hypothetical protein
VTKEIALAIGGAALTLWLGEAVFPDNSIVRYGTIALLAVAGWAAIAARNSELKAQLGPATYRFASRGALVLLGVAGSLVAGLVVLWTSRRR